MKIGSGATVKLFHLYLEDSCTNSTAALPADTPVSAKAVPAQVANPQPHGKLRSSANGHIRRRAPEPGATGKARTGSLIVTAANGPTGPTKTATDRTPAMWC